MCRGSHGSVEGKPSSRTSGCCLLSYGIKTWCSGFHELAEAAELVRSTVGSRSMHSGPLRDRPLIQRHDRDLDHHALEQIAVSVQGKITPKVALEELGEKPWAGILGINVNHFVRYSRGQSSVWRRSRSFDRSQGIIGSEHLRARMAVADSLAAAWPWTRSKGADLVLGTRVRMLESEVTCS